MRNVLKQLWMDESGISAVEYALLAAGIAVAIITSIKGVGTAVGDKFDTIKGELEK